MSFSLNTTSGIITQSGTDTDLSGLSNITGVTTTTNGIQTVYNLGDYHLRINGTLTLDPEIECLMTGDNKNLWVSGTLNFGVPTTVNGVEKYSLSTGIRCGDKGYDNFLVRNNGTFNWHGGAICVHQGLDFQAGSTVDIKNGILIGLDTTASGRVRQRSPNLTVNGIKLIGNIRFDIFKTPVEFNGYEAGYTTKGALQKVGSSDGGDDVPYEVYDFDADGINWIGSSWKGTKIEFYNMGYGGDFILTHDSATGSTWSFNPVSTLYKDIKLKIVDTNLTNIQSAKYWTKDVNNGSRNPNAATWGYGSGIPSEDFDADRIYTGSTDANGEATEQLLTRTCYGGTSSGGTYANNTTIDHRSETTDNTDIFTFRVASYAHALNSVAPSCIGTGVLEQQVVLFDDVFLTESSKAIVDAYTEIDTPQRFYDRAKAYLVDNFAGETQTIVSRDGNSIDAGSYDVVVDGNVTDASSAFAISNNTLTIKATTFVGNIATTGTTTLSNGAEVVGTFGSTTVLPWEVKNVEATSRIQLYNVTKDAEVLTTKLTGTAGEFVDADGTYTTSEIAVGDVVRLRVTCVVGTEAMLPLEVTGVATTAGLNFSIDQQADTIYNFNAIDGSSFSTWTADFTNSPMGVDLSESDGNATVQQIYAFLVYQQTTADGVDKWFNVVRAIDSSNYQLNSDSDASTDAPDVKIQNIGNVAVNITGGRIFRTDGAPVLYAADGDKPITLDTGSLVANITPQIESVLNSNARMTAIDNNSKLIPGLL